jgi:aryl-alcohol dehydrogenase-like predicted oxidoreductase
MAMQYRRLGRSGLKVSVLAFGSWVSFAKQLDTDAALKCMHAAKEGGMNFFDNAESYEGGRSEQVMGAAIAELGWPRFSYVLSTKLFWGLHDDVNMRNTLNRKYLTQAIDGSLERLGVDFVDLLFCHRADPDTPI